MSLPFDLAATEVPPGLSVIEASAGTGKTWTISHLVPRLLIDGAVERLGEVLLVTFTEDAARELGGRVRRVLAAVVDGLDAAADDPGLAVLSARLSALPPAAQAAARRRLQRALLETDQLAASTIHAFCLQVLVREAFLCGLPSGLAVLPDASAVVELALADTWRADLAGDPALARLAATEGWTLAADAAFHRDAGRRSDTVLVPPPLPVAAAVAGWQQALAAVRAQAKAHDLRDLAAQVTTPEGWTKPGAAVRGRIPAMQAALAALDPARPDAGTLAVIAAVAVAETWFHGGKKAGKAAKAAAKSNPLLLACAAVAPAQAPLRWAWRGRLAERVGRRVRETLDAGRHLTLDDLIHRVAGALADSAGGTRLAERLAARYRIILVDESQDTDPEQLAIFRRINAADPAGRLLLIGDPKQAIYGFRGADLAAYLAARDGAEAGRISTLTRTFRSAPGLVAALNALFDRPLPFAAAGLDCPPATAARSDDELPPPADGLGRLVVWEVPAADVALYASDAKRTTLIAAQVASAIRDLLGTAMGDELIAPRHCAVLTRTNGEALAVRDALVERRIPAVVRDTGDVYRSDEAVELARVLAAVLAPRDRRRRRAALATRLLGVDAAGLTRLTDADELDWVARFAAWERLWRQQGIAACLTAIERDAGVGARLAADPLGERRLTNLRHLMDLLQTDEHDGALAPERLVARLAAAAVDAEAGDAPAERQLRLERDEAAVQVLTMHRAKGLEFDLVFCPFLWRANDRERADWFLVQHDGRPHLVGRDQGAADVDALAAEARAARLAEDLRLAYVALTRARRRAWLVAGAVGWGLKQHAQAPSALDWLLGEVDPSVPAWMTATAAAKRSGGGEPHAARLAALRPLITVQPPPEPIRDPWAGAATAGAAPLEARDVTGIHPVAWGLTSFTALARGHGEDLTDRADRSATAAPPAGTGEPSPLADFPRGAVVGEAVHEVLEGWDFRAPQPATLARILAGFGLAEHAPALGGVLADLATACLPGLAAGLGEACGDPARSEWRFHLPIGRRGLDGPLLAAVFLRHARDEAERAYARTLHALAAATVDGLLIGAIDRIVSAEGRWGVIDWKSNHLGDRLDDYRPEALAAEAAASHYLLQIHLYLIVLRRHLAQRGGDPAAVAGGWLVFLRGIRPGTAAGILPVTPAAGLLDDLDRLFAGAEGSCV